MPERTRRRPPLRWLLAALAVAIAAGQVLPALGVPWWVAHPAAIVIGYVSAAAVYSRWRERPDA